MISLNVYLTPKAGRKNELERAVREVWMEAMAQQPGFLRAAIIAPFGEEVLADLEATKPSYVYEIVSYWNSEEERLAWVARDIHQEVWPHVVKEAAEVSYTLFTVEASWKL